MKTYLFEYHTDHGTETEPVHAADSLDAFNMFRASHPTVIISHIWLEMFGGGK